MGGTEPLYLVVVAHGKGGRCPFVDFLEGERDARLRARILTKVEYTAKREPDDYRRPYIDTLEGPIKEMRETNEGFRILFSLEQERGLIVLYGGERKREGPVSATLVEEALHLREEWLERGDATPLDFKTLKKQLTGKRIRWPNE